MKKVLLYCTATVYVSATLISCASRTKQDAPAATTTELTSQEQATAVVSDAPVFSSAEVNSGLAEYQPLMKEYTAAIRSKDAAKIQELGARYQAWIQSAGTWSSKLKPEEVPQYTKYMQQLNAAWAAAQNTAR